MIGSNKNGGIFDLVPHFSPEIPFEKDVCLKKLDVAFYEFQDWVLQLAEHCYVRKDRCDSWRNNKGFFGFANVTVYRLHLWIFFGALKLSIFFFYTYLHLNVLKKWSQKTWQKFCSCGPWSELKFRPFGSQDKKGLHQWARKKGDLQLGWLDRRASQQSEQNSESWDPIFLRKLGGCFFCFVWFSEFESLTVFWCFLWYFMKWAEIDGFHIHLPEGQSVWLVFRRIAIDFAGWQRFVVYSKRIDRHDFLHCKWFMWSPFLEFCWVWLDTLFGYFWFRGCNLNGQCQFWYGKLKDTNYSAGWQ